MDLTAAALIIGFLQKFLTSPSTACIIPVSTSIPIPGEISEDDRRTLIKNGRKQLHQKLEKIKDVVYSSMLVVIGGLATLSFLLLGDLITLARPDLALQISLSAFAVTLPLLAASYWNLRIWRAMPAPEPTINLPSPEKLVDDTGEYAKFSTKLAYMQLLTIVPVVVMTFVGVVSVLWHVFWIASIVFVAAVILSCGFIAASSIQHARIFLSSRYGGDKASTT
jgi:hypothetical protein